jgi:hypothetical protein
MSRALPTSRWKRVALGRRSGARSRLRVPGRACRPCEMNELPTGTYEVRARAVDKVGNERTVSALQDGAQMHLQLPVRPASSVIVGLSQRERVSGSPNRYRRVLEPHPSVNAGTSTTLQGRVTDAFGHPRGDAAVEIREQIDLPGAGWTQIATLRTSTTGGFNLVAPAGPARTIRFEYPGTPVTRSAFGEVALRVRAGVSLAPRALELSLQVHGNIEDIALHIPRFGSRRSRLSVHGRRFPPGARHGLRGGVKSRAETG